MASDNFTATPNAEIFARIETKLNDICNYIAAIKHVVSRNDPCAMGTAIDSIASLAGATADSFIPGEQQSGGCIGSYDAWLKCRG